MTNLVSDEFESYMHNNIFTNYITNNSFKQILEEEEVIVKKRQQTEKILDGVNKALKNMIDIECY